MTLQDEVRVADGAGGFTRSWKDVAELWAELEPVSGKEKLHAMQMQSTLTHRIYIRYRDFVTASQRLLFDGRYFYIKHVTSFGRSGETLELFAEEHIDT